MQKNEGGKAARASINAFHRCLNGQALLPSQTYIPANIGFTPVLIINQIIALFISHNYALIPHQIRLAYNHFYVFEGRPVFYPYRDIAHDYLCQMTYFLREFAGLDESDWLNIIPETLCAAGAKNPPEYDVQRQQFRLE